MISNLSLAMNDHEANEMYIKALELEKKGEVDKARTSYGNLIKEKNIDESLKQKIEFQYSKLSTELLKKQYPEKEELQKYIKVLIFPLLQHAISINENNDLAAEIKEYEAQLKIYLNLDPTILPSGKKFVNNRPIGYISQKLNFSGKTIQIEDESNLTVYDKPNFSFQTEAMFSIEDLFFNRWAPGFSLGGFYNKYSNQTDGAIFKNDNAGGWIIFKNTFYFKYKERDGKFKIDWEHNKKFADYLILHKLRNFSTKSNYTYGLYYDYFEFGESALEYKAIDYDIVNRNYNYKLDEFYFSQSFLLTNLKGLKLSIRYQSYDFFNDKTKNKKSVGFKSRLLFPEIFSTIDLVTLIETNLIFLAKESKRKDEVNYGIGAELIKKLNQELRFSIDYGLQKNISKIPEYNSSNFYLTSSIKWQF